MTFLSWFRRDEPAAEARAVRAPAPAAPAAPEAVESIPVEARVLVAGWRAAEGRLVVPALAPVGRGRRVALLVSGAGRASLTVTGLVAAVSPAGGAYSVEVVVDPERHALVGRVQDFLHGRAEMPKVRAPRYRLALPAAVCSRTGYVYMTTSSVSQGGCGLAWSGPAPRPGSGLHIRLGGGPRAAAFRAMVCWVQDGKGGLRVGVRFLAGEEAKLAALLGEAQRGVEVS